MTGSRDPLGRFLLLFVACALFGQDKALVRLKLEAARWKASQQGKAASRLPEDQGTLAAKFRRLEFETHRDLKAAGLSMPEGATSES